MGEYLDQIPENIREHIKQITRTSGLPNNDESIEQIARGWLEKKMSFENQIQDMDMEEIDFLDKDDNRGVLALTYSGSLINIGPVMEDGRTVKYVSIGLRQDVPQAAEKAGSELAANVKVDQSVEFAKGPIKSSSPIFKIAVCRENLEPEEQEELINKATLLLTEDFVEVNKTIISE